MRQRFEWALSALRDGRAVRRAGRTDRVAYRWCDGTPIEKRLLLVTRQGFAAAWQPSADDLLATDWELVKP